MLSAVTTCLRQAHPFKHHKFRKITTDVLCPECTCGCQSLFKRISGQHRQSSLHCNAGGFTKSLYLLCNVHPCQTVTSWRMGNMPIWSWGISLLKNPPSQGENVSLVCQNLPGTENSSFRTLLSSIELFRGYGRAGYYAESNVLSCFTHFTL